MIQLNPFWYPFQQYSKQPNKYCNDKNECLKKGLRRLEKINLIYQYFHTMGHCSRADGHSQLQANCFNLLCKESGPERILFVFAIVTVDELERIGLVK